MSNTTAPTQAPYKLRYVDVTFNFHGKDKDGNTVILPLQTEQTFMGNLVSSSDSRYCTLFVAGNRFPSVCANSFICPAEFIPDDEQEAKDISDMDQNDGDDDLS